MKTRLDYHSKHPAAFKALLQFSQYVETTNLEHSLLELVKIRASQINACAFCVHMHTRDARKAGETEARLYLLSAWRESSLFSPRERAALLWTETITQLTGQPVSDEIYNEVLEHFLEEDLIDLTVSIGMINVWNRMNAAFQLAHPVEPMELAS
ncbi:carboxymuconolactone decarboxylase family protein [Hyphococcus lacteus]|uniref:Carboxymuconolactone decarboxylase family protein n=1 Tax=Hyphococcus lacteus TaxID=3143536 RepID=A0ABV3Z8S1_9PROT